jgi:hypothetical protein
VLVWRGTTLEMNPGLDPTIVEEAYAEDAEGASAEYGAEWRSDLSDFIGRDVIRYWTPSGRQNRRFPRKR